MSSVIESHKHGQGVFWGEIAPCEHMVQIYGDDDVFLDALEGFVAGGLHKGDAVVIIATASHRIALERRLLAQGVDLLGVRAHEQYIALDVEETLAKFMVKGWPDDELFKQVITAVLTRARLSGRRVRAFGEMVAILWGRGENGATVRLEHLWHKLCQAEAFSLFCAYPKIGFTQDAEASIRDICAAHSKVIAG